MHGGTTHTRGSLPGRERGEGTASRVLHCDSTPTVWVPRGLDDRHTHQPPGSIQFPQGEMVADGGSLRLMGQKGMSGRERLDVNLPQRLRDELWLGRMLEPHGGGTGLSNGPLGESLRGCFAWGAW